MRHTLTEIYEARVAEGRSVPADACWAVFPPERTKLFRDQVLVK